MLEIGLVARRGEPRLIEPKAVVVLTPTSAASDKAVHARQGLCRQQPALYKYRRSIGAHPGDRRLRTARSGTLNCVRSIRSPRQSGRIGLAREELQEGEQNMKKTLVAAGAIMALVSAPAMAQQKSVKIGFVSTFSGPTAVIGNDMRNSFELALDHLGRKMGGLPVEVIYEDDQQKPEVGHAADREADRIRSCRLHRRLHLVERALGFAQAGGRFEDHHDQRQRRALADRRRAVLALFLLHLVAERPDARGGRPLHESEGRQERLSARPELRGRQGHAGRPQVDLQGQDRR